MPKVKYTNSKGLFQETGSGVHLPDALHVISSAGDHDLSSTIDGNTTVLINVELASGNDITLPQATAANAGQVVIVLINVDSTSGATMRRIGFTNA